MTHQYHPTTSTTPHVRGVDEDVRRCIETQISKKSQDGLSFHHLQVMIRETPSFYLQKNGLKRLVQVHKENGGLCWKINRFFFVQ